MDKVTFYLWGCLHWRCDVGGSVHVIGSVAVTYIGILLSLCWWVCIDASLSGREQFLVMAVGSVTFFCAFL